MFVSIFVVVVIIYIWSFIHYLFSQDLTKMKVFLELSCLSTWMVPVWIKKRKTAREYAVANSVDVVGSKCLSTFTNRHCYCAFVLNLLHVCLSQYKLVSFVIALLKCLG